MLQVMFARIIAMIPPAALRFCVFSNFLMLLSPNELLGFRILQTAPSNVVAQEPVCRSPLVAKEDWRRSEEGFAVTVS